MIEVADVQPGKKNSSVLVGQKALKRAVGLDYASGPGIFGPRTAKGYAAWQRERRLPATGRPEIKSLRMLGDEYKFEDHPSGPFKYKDDRKPAW